MKKNLSNIVLTCIILLALGLRLWQLGNVPSSLDWDEVALGYDAHSLFTTGKDEFGVFMPPVLRSFEDYKPALYAYLAIPSIELLGRNAFAIRLPSVIFGVLGILAFYYLVKELLADSKGDKRWRDSIALISTFFLAISPWHLQFSRIAFETNIGLTFNIFSALFFIKGLRKPWMLLVSAFFAGLNLSVYQSERVFTPLLIIALVAIYHKELLKLGRKYIVFAVLIGLLTLSPTLAYIVTNANALIRVQNTSIFGTKSPEMKQSILVLADDTVAKDRIGIFFDNRRIVLAKEIANGYLAHFDLNWLFIKGDNNRHHAPFMGLLYLFSLPLILIGIYGLIFNKSFTRKSKIFIFLWFLFAPIPASITYEIPHAVRTLNILPIYQIFTGIGLVTMYIFLKRFKLIGTTLFAGFLIFALINIFYFLNAYFVQMNYYFVQEWQYGNRQAVEEVIKIKDNYKKIIVTDSMPLDKSYMFFLFYLDYPPIKFQNTIQANGNFRSDHAFDKYEFRVFNWWIDKKNKDYLFVGVPDQFPDYIVAKKTIYYPNGKKALLIVDPKENI